MQDSSTVLLRTIAKTVLACEAALIDEASAHALPAFRACDKLRIPLRKVFGLGGFCPLLVRAIALAGAKCPWIRQLRVTVDGTLDGFAEVKPGLDQAALAEGETALITELLGLLVTFIGPAMTLSLVKDTWPPLAELNLEIGTR
jgi:hypothetical protein